MKTRLKIDRLTSVTDAEHIEKALEAVPRVASVRLNPTVHEPVAEHDGADPDTLQSALGDEARVD